MKRLMAAMLMIASGGALTACASAEPLGPSQSATAPTPVASGFPDLRSVPQTHAANTRVSHWREVQAEMLAALNDLRDNPRAIYGAPPEDPALFVEDARQDLIETRDSH